MRSLLFVPGDSERKLEKGLASGADALIIDLEDSVALDGKAKARDITAAFLRGADRAASPRLYVRVNSLDSGLIDDDLNAIIKAAPAGIMLPKAEHGQEVARLDNRILVREVKAELPETAISIIAIVTETAIGTLNAGTYRRASKRLLGMSWGAEDLSADIGAQQKRDAFGRYRDVFRHARTMCLLGAVAAEVEPIDTVFTNFKDDAGLAAECLEAVEDGFTGKLAIHPAQVAIINQHFTPSNEAIEGARRIVEAFEKAGNPGVLGLDGEMLDRPHLVRAQKLLARVAG